MIEGIVRESIAKSETKKLRQDGYLIANVYAKGQDNLNIAFKYNEFLKFIKNKETLAFDIKIGNDNLKVIIQDYQRHPVKNEFLHVDLRIVVPGLVSKYLVPVKLTGTPIGLKNKGILMTNKRRLKIKCDDKNLPNSFDVDVSKLDVGDSILIRDLEIPKGVTIMEQPSVSVTGVISSK
ncbi:MAG: LSU ribosomal protein L25p [uncultured Campylobacterales bacterium]|uniref:Large ribosomal subunit protein bL25 n=1 Tax=uncultured Campylobacterales bacterium TaxID=352960 RepID=A0A6S6RVQ4_9BACT|nr:MAG: LSU ribosomal protein L25p [uncultured Campylobacterales bacterium]